MIKINKIYVINLKHNKNKWKEIQKAFKNTPLKLNRFDAIYGKNLTDEEIKKVTTNFCYYFCSPGMIGCWLSHYKIWQQIIKNNEDNVLILEDDAYPTENFNKRLKEILKRRTLFGNQTVVLLTSSGASNSPINRHRNSNCSMIKK